jgi:hypothetical protein
MAQPQVTQNPKPIPAYAEDLENFYAFRAALVGSSGPGIGTSEPEPIPSDSFPTSDIY